MCKMAHYGNCDPETADQEYCIFHKPNKTEEEAREFYNKFVLKFFGYKLPWNKGWVFAEEIDASGFVFPKIPVNTNQKLRTGEEFSFKNAILESHAIFYQTTFESVTSFEGAVFKKFACFAQAKFKKFVLFNNARFELEVLDMPATEAIKYEFIRSGDFLEFIMGESSLIIDELLEYFSDDEFLGYYESKYPLILPTPGTTFRKAMFENGVSFYNARFSGLSDFRESRGQCQ